MQFMYTSVVKDVYTQRDIYLVPVLILSTLPKPGAMQSQ